MNTTEYQQRHEQEVETAFKEAYVYCARAYRSNLSRLNPELATAHTMESADTAWLASETRRKFCKPTQSEGVMP